MCLTQQVVLAVMLNYDAAFLAQQLFTVDATIGCAWGRLCFVFRTSERCSSVIHT